LPEKLTKIPEFYTIFARKMPDYIIRQRDRGQTEIKTSRPRPKLQDRGRGRSFEAQILALRPLWPRGLNITGMYTSNFGDNRSKVKVTGSDYMQIAGRGKQQSTCGVTL